jgi:hypothetical protein
MSEIIEAHKTIREKVEHLESTMLALPQADCPVRHYFAPGVYAREITIPEGVCLIGAVHKTDNLVVLSSGRLRLSTDDGPMDIVAPHILTCKAGAKNAAVALETSVWTNFFSNPDNETDVDRLVEILTYSKSSDLLGGSTNLQLAANKAAELEEK